MTRVTTSQNQCTRGLSSINDINDVNTSIFVPTIYISFYQLIRYAKLMYLMSLMSYSYLLLVNKSVLMYTKRDNKYIKINGCLNV